MNITKNLLTNSDCYKSGKKITPKGLQLHTVGCAQNSSSILASNWNKSGKTACTHYCIDAETENKVLQFLPDNYRSWSDAGYGNSNLITVELMESDYMKYTKGASFDITNKSKFIADITRAYNTAVKFFAYKCEEYGWNPQEKMSNGLYRISSHDEGRRLGLSSSHVDPTHIWKHINKDMDIFRADVKKAMKDITNSTTELYRVGTAWKNNKCENQVQALSILKNAKDLADKTAKSKKKMYKVFDSKGKVVYTATYTETFKSYKVKVLISDLRIRKSPNGEIVKSNGKNKYTGKGTFTIVDEKKAGNYTWGKLSSGAGWIALSDEFVKRV